MSQTALNFIITTAGYQKYASIIGSGGKVNFGTVSVGDAGSGTYTPPTQATTALTDAKDTSSVSLFEPIPGKSTKMRVNATIPQNSSGGTYSINEIGLFIQDTSGSTLFAIYGSSTSMTQKNPLSELLLDFIIDLEGFDPQSFQEGGYQPSFSFSLATQTAPGIVQLATLTDAQQQTPNRVLTADLLGQGSFIPKSCMEDTWVAAGELTQSVSAMIQPIGFYYDQIDTITILCANVDKKDDFLGVFTYSISQSSFTYRLCTTSGGMMQTYLPTVALNVSGQDPLNGSWIYQVYADPQLILLSLTNGGASTSIIDSGSSYFTSLVYHNNGYIYLFGGYNESSTTIGSYNIVSRQGDVINCGNTIYARTYPILQIVDNKIYCFGGNDPTKDGYASNMEVIEIATDNTLHSVGNFRLFPLSLANITTSAISGNYVYLFQPKRYYTNCSGADDRNFYRFDLSTNMFKTLTMPSNTILPGGSNVSSPIGLAAACGQGRICLINTYYDTSSSSTVLNAFMYTPSA